MPRKCFVCGTVYNCDPFIEGMFKNIEQIKYLFDDIHILLSYDKSNDQTLTKLIQFSVFYSKYDIYVNTNPMSSTRTENISNARNWIMDKMRELLATPEYNDQEWTHFIMMDFDDVCSEPIQLPVLRKYVTDEWVDRWDALSFNREFYYDIWALSFEPFIYSCWGFEEPLVVVYIMREEISRKLAMLSEDELFACDSAFNGFAIYKCSKFVGCHYDWHLPRKYMTEQQMNDNIRAVGWRKPYIPFDSSGTEIDTVSDCEHRHFHMQAKRDFGARIFISPLCLFYHSVTSHN